MKRLVLAEKPSVGRDIARVLGCKKETHSYIEGNNHIVTWALGHLVSLADPEQYGKEYKEWNMDVLPMMPKHWKLTVLKKTSKQFQTVKKLLLRNDIKDVIIATDAGREGELVARWILQMSGNKKPIYRLWISSVTDKAIKDGFAHLKPGKEYDDLFRAARSRAEADWLVGINATRALTCKYNAQLSCGRVQTPTLAMIMNREQEIKSFKPQKYYGYKIFATGMNFTWENQKGNQRISDKKWAEELGKKLRGHDLVITEVSKKEKKNYAPELYDLTTLQKEASKRYGFSPKQTLNIMQSLYEHHKVLTYPRTDSRYLTNDMTDTLKDRIKACQNGSYKKAAATLLRKEIKASSRFINDKKVSDHHAIIPTEQFVQLDHMTNEERKIYDMVVRRFLSVLYSPFEYEQTSMEGKAAGQSFVASGKTVVSAGWKEVYEGGSTDDDEEEQTLKDQKLPVLKQGEKLPIGSVRLTTGKTKPPAHFTEATLLAAMENPVKYMSSKDTQAAKTLGETGGLGTVATRADIIEKLFHTFLMEKRGNEIYLTSKAKQLLDLVPEDLKKPELTADWEKKLSDISKGKLKQKVFLDGIREYTEEIVGEIKTGTGTFRHDNLTNKICPNCGKRMLAVNGKNSKMLVCQDRECGYRETISRTTNARCPKCHKRMEMLVKGKEETFVCACGYKEKLSSFQARRAKEGAGVNKRDVQKYLKKQQKEAAEPVNNAFAQALSGIKLD